jgi:hypothetical protein
MAAGAMFNGRCDGSTLEIWGVIDGEVAINDVALTAVRFALLPAAMGNFTIKATTGAALLRSYVSGESGS